MSSETTYTMTIGGKGVAGAGSFDVLNPANEQVIGQAPGCSREQLDQAVAAARAAFPAWRATPIAKRREALLAIAGVLAGNVEELKRLLTAEQGKPHADAMGDILGGAYWCQAISTLDLPVTV
ncbi:MAG: aldehyde dehydrogenase family protein, partial [Caulobacter sp.]|nr:aldehyde dehydrogenase family protein [Caulobacter sp.]